MHSESTTRKEFLQTAAGVTAGAAFFGALGFNRMASADGHEGADQSITQIARFSMQEGKEDEAIATLQELVKGVEENEPGVLAYIAHRSEANPSEVVFFEVYKDEAALAAHGQTDHMNAMRAKFMQVFKPPLNIEKLNKIAGVVR